MLTAVIDGSFGIAEPIASLMHYCAAGVALRTTPELIRSAGTCMVRRLVVTVFAIAVVCLFLASGTFHLFDYGTLEREVARRIDHAAIWILIAATLTAILALAFRERWRWWLVVAIWCAALLGSVLKALFVEGLPESWWLALYLGLGWLGTLAMIKIARTRGWSSVRLLMWGGVVYSMGAMLDLLRVPVVIPRVLGPHEVFHVAVVAGAFIHWRYVEQLMFEGRSEPQLIATRSAQLC